MNSRTEGILLHEAVFMMEGVALACRKHGISEPVADHVAFEAAMHWVNRRLEKGHSITYGHQATPSPNKEP